MILRIVDLLIQKITIGQIYEMGLMEKEIYKLALKIVELKIDF
jgi:hypothetical protein